MVTVFGTVFVDVKGYPESEFNALGRNVGFVKTVYGGVGHNVVRNLNHLGHEVEFVSSVDSSAMGEDILKQLSNSKINIDNIIVSIRGMGIWHAIFNECGDLAASISQQPCFDDLESFISDNSREIISKSKAVILEIDLNAEISKQICMLCREYHKPLFILTSNLSVVNECPDLLGFSDCFVCNEIEARSLLKTDNYDDKELCLALSNKYNLNKCVVSFGENGSVYYDREKNEFGREGIFPVAVKDTSGAGDAFFTGIVHGLIMGYDLRKSTNIGAKVASVVIQYDECTTSEISDISELFATDSL